MLVSPDILPFWPSTLTLPKSTLPVLPSSLILPPTETVPAAPSNFNCVLGSLPRVKVPLFPSRTALSPALIVPVVLSSDIFLVASLPKFTFSFNLKLTSPFSLDSVTMLPSPVKFKPSVSLVVFSPPFRPLYFNVSFSVSCFVCLCKV